MSHKSTAAAVVSSRDDLSDDQKLKQSKITFLLHRLKVYLPAQLTPWRQIKESSKVVIHKNQAMAAIQCAILAIPLAIAVTMVFINLRTTYYHLPPSSTVALQFVAKLSEILMQMSLGTVLLETVRRMYLGSQSLPLGGLFAPVQVTNISYLWSLEFWGTLSSACLHGRQRLLASLLVITVFLLAALVGPSGAVLMIPRTITDTYVPSILLLDNATSVFPSVLSTDALSTSNTSKLGTRLDAVMRAEKLSSATTVTFPVMDSIADSTDGVGLYSPVLYTSRIRVGPFSSESFATMPSFSVVKGISATTRVGLKISSHAFQPLLHTTCYDNTWWPDQRPDTDFIKFGSQNPELNSLTTIADVVRHAQSLSPESKSWDPLGISSFYAVAPPTGYKKHSLLVISGGRVVTSVPEYASTHPNGSYISACTVDAAWITGSLTISNVSMIVETTNSDEIFSNSSVWQDQAHMIAIQPEIVKQLYEVVNRTAFGYYATFPIMPDSVIRSMTYALLLSLANSHDPGQLRATDGYANDKISNFFRDQGLSRTTAMVKLISDLTWTDPATLIRITINISSDTLGYSAEGIPVILSLTVIIIYGIVITVYVMYIFFTGITSSSWDSVGELFMLALNSDRPSHLKHTSVGVRTLSTYREPINLKVSDRDDSVEVVFLNSNHEDNEIGGLHQRIAYNKAY